jgi:two-component system response regulator
MSLEDTEPVEVLLVEDNQDDIDLTIEAMRAAKLSVNLNVVRDGEAAMLYLRGEDPYAEATKPDLILLDLIMPRKGGREVLREIKQDPNLTSLPVVVLTTSDSDEDVRETYDLGCNCYVTKPVDFEQFTKVVQAIGDFWFMMVKLPGREDLDE